MERQRSKLQVAISDMNTQEALRLIADGADIEEKYGPWEFTPLMSAAAKNLHKIVQALIEKGADVNTPDNSGDTPLMIAARMNFATTVKTLLAHGADIDATLNSGKKITDMNLNPSIRQIIDDESTRRLTEAFKAIDARGTRTKRKILRPATKNF
ncbi:MAG: ankyrin repeat domain-containing protein [Alphaproteobacteria bacterium]|nr:ankyrin repeat domain-containing protein [Alphaproteobacteria bacterium]